MIKVLIPIFNAEKYAAKCLNSVINQSVDKKKYQIIIIDDASTDNTQKIIESIIGQNPSVNIDFTSNRKQVFAVKNIKTMMAKCEDKDIVVILDGDDWLKRFGVLKKIEDIYKNPEIWFSYGGFEISSKPDKPGPWSKPYSEYVVNAKKYRKWCWRIGPLRTFRSFLFKAIKEEDFIDPETKEYFLIPYDRVIFYPIMEMCKKENIHFSKEILYVYNRDNPINDDKLKNKKINKEKTRRILKYLRYKKPYPYFETKT